MIQLIALDLDGTLLNSNHQISPKTLQALKKVMNSGIQIMIATGKTPISAVEVKKQLGIETWGVFTQGLTILDPTDEVADETVLPDNLSREATMLLEKLHNQFEFVIYNRNGIYTLSPSSFDAFLTAHHEPHPVAMEKSDRLFSQLPFQKILIQGERSNLDRLELELTDTFGSSVDFVFSHHDVLEILPAGTSKGGGVAWVLNKLGIKSEELMAFGDGDNDIEMLALAGIGVAMGNGTSGTKSASNYVTLTNDEDGIVDALYHFGLLKS